MTRPSNHKITAACAGIFLILMLLLPSAHAQKLPGKIRGYTVYDARIAVAEATGPRSSEAGSNVNVKLDDPTITGIGLSGIIFEIGAEFTSLGQRGTVDLITFRDIRVNGIGIEMKDYTHSFSFKKNVTVSLPEPARALMRLSSLPRAAYAELFESSDRMTVTGTALVFGRFKKFGFRFKRVVPVTINIEIDNPFKGITW